MKQVVICKLFAFSRHCGAVDGRVWHVDHLHRSGAKIVDEIQADLLEFNLQAAKAKNPDQLMHLRTDNGVNYGEIARAMASIEEPGSASCRWGKPLHLCR